MNWKPSRGWLPILGLFKSLKDWRRYSRTVYFRQAERAAVAAVIWHVLYVITAVATAILIWRY